MLLSDHLGHKTIRIWLWRLWKYITLLPSIYYWSFLCTCLSHRSTLYFVRYVDISWAMCYGSDFVPFLSIFLYHTALYFTILQQTTYISVIYFAAYLKPIVQFAILYVPVMLQHFYLCSIKTLTYLTGTCIHKAVTHKYAVLTCSSLTTKTKYVMA